jgi:cobalt/nickel transport system permease protein
MMKLESNWLDLRCLDDLAAQDSVIRRINPCIKLLTTLIFVLVVTSFPKYEIAGVLPLVLYPIVLINLGLLPTKHLFKRLLLAAPFVICIGIFNPLLDHTPVTQIGSVVISGGWLSFFSITLRFILTVLAALILVATTGIDAICTALLRIHVPKALVVQLLFMYRYIHVLLEEFLRTIQAYTLRSFHGEGLRFKVWGSLVGQLLMRTIARAQRIYQAMLCRGFDGEFRLIRTDSLRIHDISYLLGWSAFFLTARLYNIPQFLGTLLVGGFR